MTLDVYGTSAMALVFGAALAHFSRRASPNAPPRPGTKRWSARQLGLFIKGAADEAATRKANLDDDDTTGKGATKGGDPK